MVKEYGDSNIRKILRNEITWIISFAGVIWGAVVTIVLPIQELKFQSNQQSKDIAEIRLAQSDIPQMKTDIQVMNTRLEEHIRVTK